MTTLVANTYISTGVDPTAYNEITLSKLIHNVKSEATYLGPNSFWGLLLKEPEEWLKNGDMYLINCTIEGLFDYLKQRFRLIKWMFRQDCDFNDPGCKQCQSGQDVEAATGDLHACVQPFLGGDMIAIISGYDSINICDAIAELSEGETQLIEEIRKAILNYILSHKTRGLTTSDPSAELCKYTFLIQMYNNYDADGQISDTQKKSHMYDIVVNCKATHIYASLKTMYQNQRADYDAMSYTAFVSKIHRLYHDEANSNRYKTSENGSGLQSRNRNRDFASGSTNESNNETEKPTKAKLKDMSTTLKNSGFHVYSTEQFNQAVNKAKKEVRSEMNNFNQQSKNQQKQPKHQKNKKDRCTICIEKYGVNWKGSHTTDEHNSDFYKNKNAKSGGTIYNFKSGN